MANALACRVTGTSRLLLARSFTAALIEAYWFETQKRYKDRNAIEEVCSCLWATPSS